MDLTAYFSSYFIALCLGVGLYLFLVYGPNLIQVDHLEREGNFLKIAGVICLGVGILGIAVWIV